nr:hypothetical protein CFP56_62099 [Quercus suber]
MHVAVQLRCQKVIVSSAMQSRWEFRAVLLIGESHVPHENGLVVREHTYRLSSIAEERRLASQWKGSSYQCVSYSKKDDFDWIGRKGLGRQGDSVTLTLVRHVAPELCQDECHRRRIMHGRL